ncbi:hypothetical protein XFF6992_390068 [Xanthomonas citri pv. fuscans]|nr:hypothetical protein XFF6992_390068 [Xanthomonas citri pv. fuscans]SOO34173.1 hypothetical protein XFF6994_3620021 [Xanthomonas citri pv. fuscans]
MPYALSNKTRLRHQSTPTRRACQGTSSTPAGHLLLHEENNGPVKEGNAAEQSGQPGDDPALRERIARKNRVRALR